MKPISENTVLRWSRELRAAFERVNRNAGKKCVRGVRPIARRLHGRNGPEAEVMRGDCAAVRRALTDEGRPPLDASGLTLHDRLPAMTARLERGEKREACPRNCVG